MEFKFRAIDNINPSTTPRSLPTATYLPDRSLPMDGGFSGSRVALATKEAALRREIEKEQIRRDMLRRMELEEEVRRELAMEGAFGTMQRPLNSLWSNSTPMMMNPNADADAVAIALDDRIGASKSDKNRVILLAKPDLGLCSAKRKAVTHDVLDDEPSAIGLKKKLNKEWSCELCQIKASSENGLNDHLNGKKHKAREARQKRKIDEHNKKREKTAKNATAENGVYAESKTEEQLVDTMVGKSVVESKNVEQLVEMVADNGVSVTESNNEKLEEMMVDKRVTESKNEEQHREKGAATEEAGRKSALTETIKVGGLWCELCQIGTTSQVVMEEHKKGKKHIKKMNKFDQKNVCLSSTRD